MKKLNLSTGGHPFQVDDLTTLQDGIIEALRGVVDGLGSNNQAFILQGCTQTGLTINAGFIFWNGEIYPVDTHPKPGLFLGAQYYWQVQEVVLSPSPVTYQDSTIHNVHVRRRMHLVVAASLPVDSVAATTVVRLNQILGLTPQNGIIMYSGVLTNFDTFGRGKAGTQLDGWALCNGNTFGIPGGGTLVAPDLRGKFIVGLDTTSGTPLHPTPDADYNSIGDIGGEKTHTLTKSELPKHQHGLSPDFKAHGMTHGSTAHVGLHDSGLELSGEYALSDQHPSEDGTIDGLAGAPHENRPPYYTLAYIIKLL